MPYGFYLTDRGRELVGDALANGNNVKITKASFGSGGDHEADRDYGITALKQRLASREFNPLTDTVVQNPLSPGELCVTVSVPDGLVGTVNELGFEDQMGNLIVYGVTQDEYIDTTTGVDYQYKSWILLENEETKAIDFHIMTPEYEKVEQLMRELNVDTLLARLEKLDALEKTVKELHVETLTQTVTELDQTVTELESRVEALETTVGNAVDRLEAAL